jgi:hypothetical protein
MLSNLLCPTFSRRSSCNLCAAVFRQLFCARLPTSLA